MKIELIELRYSSKINSMIPKQNNVHIVHVTEIEEGRVGCIRSFSGYGIFYTFFPLVKYDLCPPPLTLQPRYFKYYPRSEKYAHNESMRNIHKLCSLEALNMPRDPRCLLEVSEKSVNALTPIILIVFRFVGVDLMGQEINQFFTEILASGIFVYIRG